MKPQQVTQKLALNNIKNVYLPVVEHFISIQGEPSSVGKKAYFIRLAGCNLDCKWCDTKYATKKPKFELIPLKQVIKMILRSKCDLIVFTGGEPLLFAEMLELIASTLKGRQFEIETNGTRNPLPQELWNVGYNVSPKLSGSGNPKEKRYRPEVLKLFRQRANTIYKFVCCDEKDLKEVNKIVDSLKISKSRVYIMPEGMEWKKYRANALKLVDKVLERNYNLAVRFQILLWGKAKMK